MFKANDIIFCFVHGSLLLGLGWLLLLAAQIVPEQLEKNQVAIATNIAPRINIKPVIYRDAAYNVDKTVICGGGGGYENDRQAGPTQIAGSPVHSC